MAHEGNSDVKTITPDDYAPEEAIARNHERLRRCGDGRQTRDMFAELGEELTLIGEVQRPAPARVQAPAELQGELFEVEGAS